MSQSPSLPPFVYVPTTGEDDIAQRRVIFHTTLDGQRALLVYSAIDRLQSLYRSDSNWVVFDIPGLQKVHDNTPYDVLYVDYDADLGPDAADSLTRAIQHEERED